MKKRPAKKAVKKRKKTVKKAQKKTVKKKTAKKARKKTVKKTAKKKVAKKSKKSPKRKVVKKAKRKVVKKSPKKKPKVTKKSSKKPTKKAKKPAKDVPKFAKPKEKRKKVGKYPVLPWVDSQRCDTVVKVLKELKKGKTISDWRINFIHVRSANLYVGSKFKIEDELFSTREDLVVTLYVRFPDGGIGEAQVPIISSAESIIRKELTETAAICENTKKNAYDLPEPDHVEFPQGHDLVMLDAFDHGAGSAVVHNLNDHVRQVLAEQDVITNCYEILTSASASRVMNSNGVDVSYNQTSVYMEVTLTAKEGENEQEHHWWTRVASPEQIDIRSTLEQQATIARDALHAVPSEGFTGDVLLSGRSLMDFFAPEDSVNPLVLHTFAKLKMMGISQLEHDKPIGEFQGEPFSITSNPRLPLGTLTVPVDEEGTPLKPVDLIKTGVFVNHITTSRYAQHMELPHTGMVSNIHLSDGATREEHLRGHSYVEIVSFSWFNPDPFSGEFSAEVRLGYVWERGRRKPFRGGHFTGNVFSNILHARFSREVMQEAHYYGPRAVLFNNATVTKRG